jgi:hypothetical protein
VAYNGREPTIEELIYDCVYSATHEVVSAVALISSYPKGDILTIAQKAATDLAATASSAYSSAVVNFATAASTSISDGALLYFPDYLYSPDHPSSEFIAIESALHDIPKYALRAINGIAAGLTNASTTAKTLYNLRRALNSRLQSYLPT